MSDPELQRYYAERAGEYDRIYAKPERQQDLARLRRALREALAGEDVLELACGTGYWTEVLAGAARSILATDVAPEVLERARRRRYPEGVVRFAEADAWRPGSVRGRFTAVFAGFWWSHVPRQDQGAFSDALRRRLAGARLVLVDNRYVEGSSTPVAGRDEHGNTYQDRTLEGGAGYRVLKNFPTAEQLRHALAPVAAELEVHELQHYWYVVARLAR